MLNINVHLSSVILFSESLSGFWGPPGVLDVFFKDPHKLLDFTVTAFMIKYPSCCRKHKNEKFQLN